MITHELLHHVLRDEFVLIRLADWTKVMEGPGILAGGFVVPQIDAAQEAAEIGYHHVVRHPPRFSVNCTIRPFGRRIFDCCSDVLSYDLSLSNEMFDESHLFDGVSVSEGDQGRNIPTFSAHFEQASFLANLFRNTSDDIPIHSPMSVNLMASTQASLSAAISTEQKAHSPSTVGRICPPFIRYWSFRSLRNELISATKPLLTNLYGINLT